MKYICGYKTDVKYETVCLDTPRPRDTKLLIMLTKGKEGGELKNK